MNELMQLDWRNPWWLVLALLPFFVFGFAAWRQRKVSRYADAHLYPWAVRGAARSLVTWKNSVLLLAWTLLAVAAAGPRVPLISITPESSATRVHDIDLVVALDVSLSMQTSDISPRRLTRAKLELMDLLKRLHGERIGLIAFSGTAGLITPPTIDYGVFARDLALTDGSLFQVPGSNISAALHLARVTLGEDARRTRAVLLITDGGEAEAITEAQQAARELWEHGVTLTVYVVATAEGAQIPGTELKPVFSQPDVNALRELAPMELGGRVEFVHDGDADWRALYDDTLLTLPGADAGDEHAVVWRELYPFALAPALLLWMAVHWPARLRPLAATISVVTLIFLLSLAPSPVFASEESDAHGAYAAGDYALAQMLYRAQRGYAARLGEGAAAYRRAMYAEATAQFSAALLNATTDDQRADALFNLGNALYKYERYREAVDAYSGVLSLRGDDEHARANQALALQHVRAQSVDARVAEGVPRRRGRALGETPLGANDDAPPVIDNERAPVPVPQRRATLDGAELAIKESSKSDSFARFDNPERDYRAALKKLELLDDRPDTALRALIKLDAARDAPPNAKLPPW